MPTLADWCYIQIFLGFELWLSRLQSVLLVLLLSAYLLKEGLMPYERLYPCHNTQGNVFVEFCVLSQFKSHSHLVLICLLQSEQHWLYVWNHAIFGLFRSCRETFLIFILNTRLWTKSKPWMIPNVMYHRQNPVDLCCEVYTLAISAVNKHC